MEPTYTPRRPVCRICGEDVDPGTLLTHERTAHPAPAPAATARKPYTCRQPKCCEVYGPRGHVPGLEGPHAY